MLRAGCCAPCRSAGTKSTRPVTSMAKIKLFFIYHAPPSFRKAQSSKKIGNASRASQRMIPNLGVSLGSRRLWGVHSETHFSFNCREGCNRNRRKHFATLHSKNTLLWTKVTFSCSGGLFLHRTCHPARILHSVSGNAQILHVVHSHHRPSTNSIYLLGVFSGGQGT